jgi:hypothetical protein
VARSRQRRRGSRNPGPAPTRQGRGVAAAAEIASTSGLRSDGNRHRQTEILRSGASRNWLLWIARARTACQQSSGEFSSAASTTRTKDARLQINQVGSAFCFRSMRPQHIQCTTTFNQASDASTVPQRITLGAMRPPRQVSVVRPLTCQCRFTGCSTDRRKPPHIPEASEFDHDCLRALATILAGLKELFLALGRATGGIKD